METGGFLPGIQMGEDRDLWIHIALKYRIAFSWDGETVWHMEADNRLSNTLNLISFERTGRYAGVNCIGFEFRFTSRYPFLERIYCEL